MSPAWGVHLFTNSLLPADAVNSTPFGLFKLLLVKREFERGEKKKRKRKGESLTVHIPMKEVLT